MTWEINHGGALAPFFWPVFVCFYGHLLSPPPDLWHHPLKTPVDFQGDMSHA